jgi:hypothetical protein
MRLHEQSGDVKTYSEPFILPGTARAVVLLEDVRQVLLGDAGTTIRHREDD